MTATMTHRVTTEPHSSVNTLRSAVPTLTVPLAGSDATLTVPVNSSDATQAVPLDGSISASPHPTVPAGSSGSCPQCRGTGWTVAWVCPCSRTVPTAARFRIPWAMELDNADGRWTVEHQGTFTSRRDDQRTLDALVGNLALLCHASIEAGQRLRISTALTGPTGATTFAYREITADTSIVDLLTSIAETVRTDVSDI